MYLWINDTPCSSGDIRAFPNRPAANKGLDIKALWQKGPTAKGPYGNRAYRLKDKHLKGIWIACQFKAELLLLYY